MRGMLYSSYLSWVRKNPAKVPQSIKRLMNRIVEPALKDEGNVYDDSEPRKIEAFSRGLVLDKAGSRLELLDWQRFLIALLFGLKDRRTAESVFSEVFLFIGKKNGKTSFSSMLALYLMLKLGNGQVILVATDYQQCEIAFQVILGIIDNTPELNEARELDEIYVNERGHTILYRENATTIVCFPETRIKSAQGKNPDFLFFDEIASYKSREIITKLTSGQNKRGAITIYATTAETNLTNPGKLEYDRALLTLAGKAKVGRYLPIVYELDQKDDFNNPATWIKANPSIDVVRPSSKIQDGLTDLKSMPVNLASFRAYMLNQWSTFSDERIRDDEWQQCLDNYTKYRELLSPEKLKTCPCVMSGDLSRTTDWTAIGMVFYIQAVDRYYFLHRFFIPYGRLEEKLVLEGEQLRGWIDEGLLIASHDGALDGTINMAEVGAECMKWHKQFPDVMAFAIDPAHGMALKEYLGEHDVELFNKLVDFEQGYGKVGPATTLYYDSVLTGKVIDPNPIMDWQRSQASVFRDKNMNMHFVKPGGAQSAARIDGIDQSLFGLKVLVDNLPKSGALLKVPSKEELDALPDIE